MPVYDLSLLTPVYRTAEIREIEQRAAALPNPPALMERAGLAAAELARDLASNSADPVLVFAGPGNNGGDALVLARYLKQWFFSVTVVFAGDPQKLSADASAALSAWRGAGGELLAEPPVSSRWSLAIDGLFGIGLKREISGRYLEWVNRLNALSCPILAIDIPSGLDSDTGRVLGRAVQASHTITFIGLKPGLLTGEGPDCCGEIQVARLGLEAAHMKTPSGWLLNASVITATLKPRSKDSHKGSYGGVGVIGGARGMVGAALLAGRAALHMGAGRVYLGLLAADEIPVDAKQPELMLRPAGSLFGLDSVNTLVVGPGLGQSPAAAHVLTCALQSAAPLVLDADALNLIGAHDVFKEDLRKREAPVIITPHPAEAARLLGVSTKEVQQDRVAAACQLAASYRAATLLKGAGSVCALPSGEFYLNPTGNPGLASGGTGDVLSGMIGAFLGQGAAPERALLTAVYLHGAAADELVKSGSGPIGLTASELVLAARGILNRAVCPPHPAPPHRGV